MKNYLVCLLALLTLVGCGKSDGIIASDNISTDASNFKVTRRVVHYNSINSDIIIMIEGKCSLQHNGAWIDVVCKDGDVYRKHFLGLSDNVTYFVEQLDDSKVSVDHYKVVFKPKSIIPEIEIR